jgi:cytochrome c-type protein NapC
MSGGDEIGWMGWGAAACAVLAACILVMHLVRRPGAGPEARRSTRLWLLFGLGIFPLGSAGSANVAGFKATQSRKFCGSCHVMEPHAEDSADPSSRSLAAIHARNHSFGSDNCYTCHKDYGMYGYVLTKAGGMRHVYLYLTEFHGMPLAESKRAIRIRAPVPNGNCMYCHTTTAPRWLSVGDHASSLEAVRKGTVGCASPGCHGFAHPMTKLGKELDAMGMPPIPDAGTDGGGPR